MKRNELQKTFFKAVCQHALYYNRKSFLKEIQVCAFHFCAPVRPGKKQSNSSQRCLRLTSISQSSILSRVPIISKEKKTFCYPMVFYVT